MQDVTVFDVIGLIGVAGYLLSYAVVQFKREFVETVAYSAANLVSAFLVSVSLFMRLILIQWLSRFAG